MSNPNPSPSTSTAVKRIPTERDALLPRSEESPVKLFKSSYFTPRSRWLILFVMLASLARGLTLAARTQALIQLSCSSRIDHHTLPVLSQDSSFGLLSLVSQSVTRDDIPSSLCAQDPYVQASAARLQTLLQVLMGVLTICTTGWWGRWSGQAGRTRVLFFAAIGLAISESIYGIVTLPSIRLHGYGGHLLILSPLIEGLFGGWPTLQAALNAYISDCTSPDSCSKLFSRFMGLIYIGFAIGPDISSFLLHQQHAKSIVPLFFASSSCYLLVALYSLFIIPESLKAKVTNIVRTPSGSPARSAISGEIYVQRQQANVPLWRQLVEPLASLRPRRVGALKKDYALFWIAIAYFFYLLSLAIFGLKYLYAEHVFGWDAEHLGYYISTMGFIRAFNLLIFLPIVIHFFKPRKHRDGRPPNTRQVLKFDLWLLRIQLGMDVISHTLVVTLPPDSQHWFVAATALTSMGSGSIPALHATVLGYVRLRSIQAQQPPEEREDVGTLFGALATLQSAGQMIIGPILFGILYSSTVHAYPRAIFVVAGAFSGLGFVLMLLVRPRKRVILIGPKRTGDLRVGRGRSALTKDIVMPSPAELYRYMEAAGAGGER